MASYDIVGYTYDADLYCSGCIASAMGERPAPLMTAEQQLDYLAAQRNIDRQDEATFDSGEFPKVVFRDMLESDERCGRCGHILGE